MHPRQSSLTFTPVLPRFLYSTFRSFEIDVRPFNRRRKAGATSFQHACFAASSARSGLAYAFSTALCALSARFGPYQALACQHMPLAVVLGCVGSIEGGERVDVGALLAAGGAKL
jgi:hypothetical protein